MCRGELWLAVTVFSVAFSLAACQGTTLAEAQPERRAVFTEGFEGDGEMTLWTSNGPYKVNFAGPTEERAATGKRSFKIDVTWTGCTYNYWWLAPLWIPCYGNPVVRGKVYAERGGANLGYAFAVPEAGINWGVHYGVKVGESSDGWTEFRSSAVGPGADATHVQGIAVYLEPDKEGRTVVYVDDLEVEAARDSSVVQAGRPSSEIGGSPA